LKAIDELIKVEMLTGYEIKEEIVHFEKIPTPSQQRYLEGQRA
jgi:hypothetical protein